MKYLLILIALLLVAVVEARADNRLLPRVRRPLVVQSEKQVSPLQAPLVEKLAEPVQKISPAQSAVQKLQSPVQKLVAAERVSGRKARQLRRSQRARLVF